MDEAGYLLVQVIYAIFKNHPLRAYTVFAFIVALVLGTLLLFAQDPNDRVFFIFGVLFVCVLVLRQTIRASRQGSVQDIQTIDDEAIEQ
jgi:uncharacterized membrane protein